MKKNNVKQSVPFVSLLIGAALVSGSSVAASFTNGSFESGGDPGSAIVDLPVGFAGITGWVVTDDNVDYIGTLWAASDGARSIDLNGNQPGALSQTFDTVVAQLYEVTFDLAGNPAGGSGTLIKTLQVSAAGDSQQYQFDVTGRSFEDMGWVTQNFQFMATSISTTLRFESLTTAAGVSGAPWYGPALDNVRVSEVPLPGTLALLAPAFLAAGWFRRR